MGAAKSLAVRCKYPKIGLVSAGVKSLSHTVDLRQHPLCATSQSNRIFLMQYYSLALPCRESGPQETDRRRLLSCLLSCDRTGGLLLEMPFETPGVLLSPGDENPPDVDRTGEDSYHKTTGGDSSGILGPPGG